MFQEKHSDLIVTIHDVNPEIVAGLSDSLKSKLKTLLQEEAYAFGRSTALLRGKGHAHGIYEMARKVHQECLDEVYDMLGAEEFARLFNG